MESSPEPRPAQEDVYYPLPYNPQVSAYPYPDPQAYGYPSVQIYPNPAAQSYPLPQYPAVPLIYPGQPVGGPRRRVRRPAGQSRALTPTAKLLVYSQLSLSILTLILSILALNLNHWVQYCSIHIGIRDTYYDGDTISFDEQEATFCPVPYNSLSDCGDICSNMKRFKASGTVMTSLGTPAILFTGMCFLHLVLLLVRRRSCCRGLCMRFGLVAAMALWVMGTVMYLVAYWSVQSEARTSIEEGFSLAIVVAMLQLGHCVLGNAAITKLV